MLRLCLADRTRRLHIDNDTMIVIDQVIGFVGDEGMASVSAGPLGGRIKPGDELRCNGRRSTESGIIENSQTLSDRAVMLPVSRACNAFFHSRFVDRFRSRVRGAKRRSSDNVYNFDIIFLGSSGQRCSVALT
jgi:hypothetical protein